MTNQEIAALILEESNEIVYIANPETYELKYLNQACIDVIGNPCEKYWMGKPCYKILQGKEQPCEFCTNAILTQDKYHVWDFYNSTLNKYFILKDKLIDMEGKIFRLEIAMDVTEKELANQLLNQQLHFEETLLACVRTLDQNEDLDHAVTSLLNIIATYYGGDRAYIIELKYEEDVACNTYEWCLDGIVPQIYNLQDVPLHMADPWLAQFEESGEFYASTLESTFGIGTGVYDLLESQEIASMIAAPLITDDKVIGFLGVDNPVVNFEDTDLIRSVSAFVMNDLKKRNLLQELSRQSYMDSLTGLYNRNKYMQVLNKYSTTHPNTLGVVYIDINGLKAANDKQGHEYGDILIQTSANMLRLIFGSEDIYRIGGDEFVVICANMTRFLFEQKVLSVRQAIEVSDEIDLSIGVSWSSDQVDINHQIKHTDELMYLDKENYYSMSLDIHSKYKSKQLSQLLTDLQNGRYFIQLQPKIRLRTGQVVGAEALVRKWNDEDKIIPPVDFIHKYETEGIIRHIDFFVLESVCKMLNAWHMESPSDLVIAVNMSRITLMEYRITEKLVAVCRKYKVDPKCIIIEVTESIGLMERDELENLITCLKDQGFAVVLDDFGSDYSNLSLLISMGFSEIKLDRSLIENLESNEKSRLVTSYTINLCKALNQSTSVAEGIETEGQRDILDHMDCDIGQGYFFSRPIRVNDFYTMYLNAKAKSDV